MPMDFSKTKRGGEQFVEPLYAEYELVMLATGHMDKCARVTSDAPSYEEWVAEKRRAFESATPSTPARQARIERELQELLRKIEQQNEERRREYQAMDIEP